MFTLTTATLAAVVAYAFLIVAVVLIGHRVSRRNQTRRRLVTDQIDRVHAIADRARASQRLTTNGLR
jgi:D-serine deaminase-like pyridoxal phosphate-dependent protein